MKNKEAVDLRQKAEELLSKKTSKTGAQISENEMQKLVHELEVHQIELELQNEELMLARAEEKKTSEKYVDLYDFAPSGYFLLSSEGSIIELNLAGASLLGKERSYLKNKPFALFIAQESKSTFSQFFENVLKSNKMLACDAALSVSNESALYTHLTGIATENKEQILLTLVDITKRVEAEHELSKSRDLLQSIIENAPIRVFWKDVELRYLGANSIFAQDAGMSGPEDMIGKDDFQMGWKEQAELYRADDQYVMDTGKSRIAYEEPQTTPDGQTIWLRTSKVPLRDANRKVIGILGIYDDITELKKADKALRSSEEMMRTSQSVAHICSYSTNLNVNKIGKSEWVCSPEFYNIFGIDETYPHTI